MTALGIRRVASGLRHRGVACPVHGCTQHLLHLFAGRSNVHLMVLQDLLGRSDQALQQT